jgi:hypothetical protein
MVQLSTSGGNATHGLMETSSLIVIIAVPDLVLPQLVQFNAHFVQLGTMVVNLF